MKLLILPLLAAVTLSSCTHQDAVKVCSVHDGDTLTTCAGDKVRLKGIDAPELKQAYGLEAREALKRLVLSQNVSLLCDGKSFRRRVCLVTRTGKNINEEMVKEGFAFDYKRYSHGAFLNAQALAQSKGLGIWQNHTGGARPWAYRHRHAGKRYARREEEG